MFYFQGYRIIGFYGNGFVKYKVVIFFGEKGDIFLLFRIIQRDVLLLFVYDND